MVAVLTSGLQGIITAPGVKGRSVTSLSDGALTDFLRSIIKDSDTGGEPEPFYVLDLGIVDSLVDAWSKSLPMVHPFYAVKCNPEKALLGTLAHLGASFDCASRAEIESVLSVGVSPDKIVFANPCKPESHIQYAAEIEPLLVTAQSLRLPVVGVSFHIGSGATESGAYQGAIAAARSVFDTAIRLGLPRMHMLDIGGGFTSGSQFEDAATEIRAALDDYFSEEPGLKVISEPGRFFSETAFTLAATIIGKRVRGGQREYWINDGLYGSMNCILYDHATVRCAPLAFISNPGDPTCQVPATYSSTVFGPTCDALDTVFTGRLLPDLKVNDWLVFPDMGAYTAAAGSNFNGFNADRILTHLAYSTTVNHN
ncbi:Ornithine decarboxylase 1A, chloroplastic [Linum grandiflorum]